MSEGTIAYFYYLEMRKQNIPHADCIRNFIDGINNMKSSSFSVEQLKKLKQIIHKVKGKID